MPARKASITAASGYLPFARRAEPCPRAGTVRPSRNLTVRAAAGACAAASRGIVSIAAAQNPVNSRRFKNRFLMPIVTLVVSTAATRGTRAALVTVIGTTLGNAALLACIALGLNWILKTSAEVFEILRWVGAACLGLARNPELAHRRPCR